jgi:hypothetical protein
MIPAVSNFAVGHAWERQKANFRVIYSLDKFNEKEVAA